MSTQINSSPIIVDAGITTIWDVEWITWNLGGYNAWAGNIFYQPQPIEPGIFLQVSQTQLMQINSDMSSDVSPAAPPDTTTELQIQVTNTGGPPWAPGSSPVSFNLWSSCNSSGLVGGGENIILAPGYWFGIGVSYGGWPGNVLVEPQPTAPSFGVFLPNYMTGVMADSGNNDWFYIFVENTDPSNGGNPVSFNLQSSNFGSGVVGGADDIIVNAGATFTTGVSYGGGSWPGNVFVQPQPFVSPNIFLPYSFLGVMQDSGGSYWFYIEVQGPPLDTAGTIPFAGFALQSSTS
jgi:hypothetical protein